MRGGLTYRLFRRPLPIAPLVTFRILFGGLMMVGALRFMLSGWIERLYVEPNFFFSFYGFEWVEPLNGPGMYAVYTLVALSAAGIMLGYRYRISALLFFLSFTYTELVDATNYLNHYYLVCLLALLLIILPAHRRFSLDVRRRPELAVTHVPAWCIHLIMFQIGVVYFFAGFAKLNPDWLFRAMPLAVWLPEHADMPLLGSLFELSWMPFVFSWAGAIYDLTIPLWLSLDATRKLAYAAVVVFHALTKMLFNIGLFPFIMIFNTLIFFPARYHEYWLGLLGYKKGDEPIIYTYPTGQIRFLKPALVSFVILQLLLPWRYLLYPGHVLWHEQGYRFSWRVMLVEKTGYATFTVLDRCSGLSHEVENARHLTPFQEKQMAIQPDFILQYARFLAREYQQKHGFSEPEVRVNSHVALNARASQPFIDPDLDLLSLRDNWGHKHWILPFEPR